MPDALTELLHDLDEAIDSGGEVVLVSQGLLQRCHAAIGKLQKRRTALAMMEKLGWPEDGPVETSESPSKRVDDYKEARDLATRDWERSYLVDLLKLFPSNLSRAARHAGIDRNYLKDLLARNGLVMKPGRRTSAHHQEDELQED